MTSSPNCGRAKADLSLLGYYAWGKANSGSDRSGSFPWFAHGSASDGKHFRPPLSPSRSPAATSAAALQKRWDHLRAGLDLVLDQRGRGHGRPLRRRQRIAGARLQGEGGRSAGEPGSTPAWSRWSPNCAATSANSVFAQNMAKLNVAKALGTLAMDQERS